MGNDLSGKVAFVSGSASGIGKATAEKLAALGATVYATDINTEEGQIVVNDIIANGGKASFHQLDVSDDTSLIALMGLIVAEEGRIDIGVNNAGIGGAIGSFHKMSAENWSKVIDVNLTAVFRCMQLQISSMLKTGGGNIVNIASLAGVNGMPYGVAYAASKHAVIGLTKSAALEYGSKSIRVNTVCPGFVETKIIEAVPQTILDYSTNLRVPLKRIGQPEEVANTIAWLVGQESSYVNGHSMYVDGGFMAG